MKCVFGIGNYFLFSSRRHRLMCAKVERGGAQIDGINKLDECAIVFHHLPNGRFSCLKAARIACEERWRGTELYKINHSYEGSR